MGVVSSCTDKYQKCIDACNRCFQACHECARLCLNEPDVATRKDHIGMMLECAGICKEAACFMVIDAKHVKEICSLCATICNECAANVLSSRMIIIRNALMNAVTGPLNARQCNRKAMLRFS